MTREELLKIAKPILFNTEMVRAILEGRKTVTRRCVKFPANRFVEGVPNPNQLSVMEIKSDKVNFHQEPFFCISVKPPFKVGDYLYVRETWTEEYKKFYYRADYDSDYLEPCETLSGGYPADCRYYPGCVGCTRGSQRIMWHPSIHMPKEAARLFLKVTDVRVERLKFITGEQVIAEGISREWAMSWWKPTYSDPDSGGYPRYIHTFKHLWNSTIKKADLDKYGWEANPWVWVIELERVEV